MRAGQDREGTVSLTDPETVADRPRIAPAFGKMPATAHHFGRDCGRVWQGNLRHFNAYRCGGLSEMTAAEQRVLDF
jgi:hypothetical protein